MNPLAERISAELPRELLSLRTRLLVKDICGRYGCGISTAMHSVALARVSAGVERRHAN